MYVRSFGFVWRARRRLRLRLHPTGPTHVEESPGSARRGNPCRSRGHNTSCPFSKVAKRKSEPSALDVSSGEFVVTIGCGVIDGEIQGQEFPRAARYDEVSKERERRSLSRIQIQITKSHPTALLSSANRSRGDPRNDPIRVFVAKVIGDGNIGE